MNNKWITDRLPTEADADSYGYVWVTFGSGVVRIQDWRGVPEGMPWMPTSRPQPYVKPKRYCVSEKGPNYYTVWQDDYEGGVIATRIPTREAAERIAAIYEEVMP